jgi:hypothetical protein
VPACQWLPESSDFFFLILCHWIRRLTIPAFACLREMKVQIHILFGRIHRALCAVYHDVGVTNMNRVLRI